jgi:hypothetical protein
LRSGTADAPALSFENRIRRLRGETTDGGRRRKTRRSKGSSRRSKTFSKRK